MNKNQLNIILNIIFYGLFIFLVLYSGFNLYKDWDYKPKPLVKCINGSIEEYNESALFQCGEIKTKNIKKEIQYEIKIT